MKNFLLIVFCLCLVACSKDQHNLNPDFKNSKNELFVLALDISQSFERGKIEPEYIRELCNSVSQKSKKATIVIFPLGNPSHDDTDIIAFDLNGLISHSKPVTLSHKKNEVLRRKKLQKENEKIINDFVSEYENKIYSATKTQHTDIASFNEYLHILSKEERFQGCNKTLFMYSDGINSIKGVDEFYPLKEEIEGLDIYTCGLANSAKPFTQDYKELTNYKAFFQKFKTESP